MFDRREASDCSARVVFPDFGVSKALPAFATTAAELTPQHPGEFGFACGMNMLQGRLLVEDGDGPVPAPETGDAVCFGWPRSDCHMGMLLMWPIMVARRAMPSRPSSSTIVAMTIARVQAGLLIVARDWLLG